MLSFLSPSPTSWSSLGIRNNYLQNNKIILTEIYSIFFQNGSPPIGTCAYRQESGLRADAIYFSTNQPARSVHQYTSLHVAAFSAWHITLLRGLFESEPFKLMPYRSLKCLGTYPLLLVGKCNALGLHNIAERFIMGQRNVWG